MDVVPSCNGLEVQVELSSRRFMGLKERRRALAGRTGCGVCGVEQLNDIGKPVQPLPFTQTFNLAHLDNALRHLPDFQPVGQLTGCTHAAAGYSRQVIWRADMKMLDVMLRWINCWDDVRSKGKPAAGRGISLQPRQLRDGAEVGNVRRGNPVCCFCGDNARC